MTAFRIRYLLLPASCNPINFFCEENCSHIPAPNTNHEHFEGHSSDSVVQATVPLRTTTPPERRRPARREFQDGVRTRPACAAAAPAARRCHREARHAPFPPSEPRSLLPSLRASQRRRSLSPVMRSVLLHLVLDHLLSSDRRRTAPGQFISTHRNHAPTPPKRCC